tara:strand:+ start:1237 stop:1824 length:588 start_codon:yes stop_codon:yes gene_type:complete
MKNLTSAQTLEHELQTAKDLKLTVKNIKYFSGHDGMQGINADIYHEGKKLATAYDDARGGEMDIRPFGYDEAVLTKFLNIERELKALPEYLHIFGIDRNGKKIGGGPVTIRARVDLAAIVDAVAQKKESDKQAKKGLMYLIEDEEYIIQWKGLTLKSMIKKYQGLNIIQDRYDGLKKEGKTVLNLPYLTELGVKV